MELRLPRSWQAGRFISSEPVEGRTRVASERTLGFVLLIAGVIAIVVILVSQLLTG